MTTPDQFQSSISDARTMNEYEILKDFPGSQDGVTTELFKAGTTAKLSDYLVSCVDKSWIRPVASGGISNKAIITEGKGMIKKAIAKVMNK